MADSRPACPNCGKPLRCVETDDDQRKAQVLCSCGVAGPLCRLPKSNAWRKFNDMLKAHARRAPDPRLASILRLVALLVREEYEQPDYETWWYKLEDDFRALESEAQDLLSACGVEAKRG